MCLPLKSSCSGVHFPLSRKQLQQPFRKRSLSMTSLTSKFSQRLQSSLGCALASATRHRAKNTSSFMIIGVGLEYCEIRTGKNEKTSHYYTIIYCINSIYIHWTDSITFLSNSLFLHWVPTQVGMLTYHAICYITCSKFFFFFLSPKLDFCLRFLSQ